MIVAIVFYAAFSTSKVTEETHIVTMGSIKQFVKVSGQVEASKDANLSFQAPGSVSFVGVKVGDTVTQGKVLATLSGSDAQASVMQAEANLANAQAVLAQLQQGARKEEVAIKEQTLQNAQESLNQSYSALPDAIQNVDAVTADVIKNKFASFFTLSNGRYVLSFSSCDQRLQSEIENNRTLLQDTLADFQKKSSVITALSATQTIDSAFESAYQSALATNALINQVSNLLLASCSITNPSLDGYRTSLSLAKTSMTSLFSDIALKRSALITSKNVYNQAKRDLDLTKAGTDPFKIEAQQASVASALAQVATAKSGLRKTTIVAPFSGVISSVDLSLGETVTVGKTVISMVAIDGYEVEAKVPEIDIVKVKVGAEVDVTLDAYGRGVVFKAVVTRINPTATIEGSVPVYTVIVSFIGKDDRIKQGMTSNIQIATDSKDNVITVPARFVTVINGEQGTVTTLVNGEKSTKNVTLGIRGEDGSLEIRSGLVSGDVLVSPSTTDRQAQKTN